MSNIAQPFVGLCLALVRGHRGLLPPAASSTLDTLIEQVSLPAVTPPQLRGMEAV